MTVATQEAVTPAWRLLRRATSAVKSPVQQPSDWADLPVLPSTQLRLELVLLADPPSLREFTVVFREDPVAVLRLFALAAGLAGAPLVSAPADPLRLQDLVVTLGKQDLLQAFCQQPPARDTQAATALAFAAQAAAMGWLCRTIAETIGLPAEEAYLVGLLHGIGSLPEQLGQNISQETTRDRCGVLSTLCRRYALPSSLQQTLEEVYSQEAVSPWTAVVHAAYELHANSLASRCPSLTRGLVQQSSIFESFLRTGPGA